MIECAVCDASPLIFFSKAGHLPLLKASAKRILVPQAVATEIRARGEDDPLAVSLATTDWLEVQESVPAIPLTVAAWGLGSGESAVLAHALNVDSAWCLLDDLAGRKCAGFLGLRVRGTLGIVLKAKQRGEIASARDVMDDLLATGLYLSQSTLDHALALVGE